MNLFEILFHPDREEQSEREEVARAADLLQVNEFQLLQLAYKAWFDKEIPSRECDRLFGDYMLHKDVPHWAHHYARRIIRLDAAGSLDDRDAAYHRYDPQFRTIEPEGVNKFCLAAALIVAVLGTSLWFSHMPHKRHANQSFALYTSDRDFGVIKHGFDP